MISTSRLASLGFTREQFPDGWFWYLKFTDSIGDYDLALRMSYALGYNETCEEDLPDTIIMQMGEDNGIWTIVYGADVYSIDESVAEEVIHKLEETLSPR